MCRSKQVLGVVPSVLRVWAVGFATQRGDLWKVSVASLGTVWPFSCVPCHCEQHSDTGSDQKCSGLVCSGREPWLCKACPVSGLLPQMAAVGAGDSPKAILACPLLSVYLFVLSSTGRLSKSYTSYTNFLWANILFLFQKIPWKQALKFKKINISEVQKAFISWCESKSYWND